MFLIISICLYHKQFLSSFLRLLPFLTAKTVMKWDEVCKMIPSLQKCTGLQIIFMKNPYLLFYTC